MGVRPHGLRRVRRAFAVLLAVILLAACGGASGSERSAGETDDASGSSGGATTLYLGYFPNVTHATALVGDREGIFSQALGPDVALKTQFFNAGPEATEALFGEAIDATFIGPNPAINAFAQSGGDAIRIISGSTSGGAFLVVREGISTAADLRGKKVGTPQLGNTQDVALRAWLAEAGLSADHSGGGDVSIQPQANADILAAFVAGDLDGAWVPEPWATRMLQEGAGEVLVDERDLWPGGKFVTTHLIVRTEYLDEHPDVVRNLIAGVVEATEFANDRPDQAKAVVREGIAAITGEDLAPKVLDAAWQNLLFTVDPVASSLAESKDDAVSVELLDDVDLDGIYDLTLLNEVLSDAGHPPVEGL
jgi:NitT/TauT family transport system substrate-binding protein